MMVNIQKDINYLNEALFLGSYVFNTKSTNDENIYFWQDDLNVESEKINQKFDGLREFFIKTRLSVRNLSEKYKELEVVLKKYDKEEISNLIYFIMYDKLENSIKFYSKDEFRTLYIDTFRDNLLSLGEIEEDLANIDYLEVIDKISIFNEIQKFALVKLINNTNGYFDKLYDFILEIEEIVFKNLYLIEDIIKEIFFKFDIEYLKKLKEFDAISSIIEKYKIQKIEISCKINFYEKVGFSIFEEDSLLVGNIYFGLVPFILKDYFKDDKGKEDVYNILFTIADETRFKIIHLLNGNRMYGKEIAKELDITTGTVSHHLTKLIKAKIVYSEVDGNRVYYFLNHNVVNYLGEYFKSVLGDFNEK